VNRWSVETQLPFAEFLQGFLLWASPARQFKQRCCTCLPVSYYRVSHCSSATDRATSPCSDFFEKWFFWLSEWDIVETKKWGAVSSRLPSETEYVWNTVRYQYVWCFFGNRSFGCCHFPLLMEEFFGNQPALKNNGSSKGFAQTGWIFVEMSWTSIKSPCLDLECFYQNCKICFLLFFKIIALHSGFRMASSPIYFFGTNFSKSKTIF